MFLALARRILQALLTLLATSVAVWALLLLAPGDPARTVLGARGVAQPTPALIAQTRRQLGLNEAILPRYWHWLTGALRGDFGTSWQTGRPVMDDVGSRLPATARLTLVAMLIAIALALLLGLTAGVVAGSWLDRIVRAITLVMVVTPGFLIGLLILNVVVLHWNIGVIVSDGQWDTVGWPAFTLALGSAGYWARILRASVIEARSAPYLQVSAARGAAPWRQLIVHVLPNSLPPFLTVVGLGAAELLGGAPIAETVYSWPGVGQYAVQAIGARDLPVVVTYTMIAVAAFVVASLLIDVLLVALDPRLRAPRRRHRAVEFAEALG